MKCSFPLQYQDLASLTTLPKYTSGKVYYYPAFSATRDGDKMWGEKISKSRFHCSPPLPAMKCFFPRADAFPPSSRHKMLFHCRYKEVCKNLAQTLGWEAVMRVRCGKGLRISTFHGHFFIRSTDLLALP